MSCILINTMFGGFKSNSVVIQSELFLEISPESDEHREPPKSLFLSDMRSICQMPETVRTDSWHQRLVRHPSRKLHVGAVDQLQHCPQSLALHVWVTFWKGMPGHDPALLLITGACGVTHHNTRAIISISTCCKWLDCRATCFILLCLTLDNVIYFWNKTREPLWLLGSWTYAW